MSTTVIKQSDGSAIAVYKSPSGVIETYRLSRELVKEITTPKKAVTEESETPTDPREALLQRGLELVQEMGLLAPSNASKPAIPVKPDHIAETAKSTQSKYDDSAWRDEIVKNARKTKEDWGIR